MYTSRARRAIGTGLLVFALGGLTGTPAAAEPEKTPSKADLAEAERLYKSGVEAAKKKDWERARAAHAAAWRLAHHVQIAVHLGRAELNTGKYRDAAEHLFYFLQEAKKVGEEDRKDVEKLFVDARSKVGALRISVQPMGAEVLVDEAPVGKAPITTLVFVEPGRRVVAARMGGFVTTRAVQDVAAGGLGEVALTLPEVRQPEPPPPPPLPPDVGGGPNKAVVVSGIVATVALAGAGVGLRVAAGQQPRPWDDTLYANCQNKNPDCHYNDSALDAFNAREQRHAILANASTAAFVGAGAVGVGTLIYTLITASSNKEKARTQTSFNIGPGGFGASLTTSW